VRAKIPPAAGQRGDLDCNNGLRGGTRRALLSRPAAAIEDIAPPNAGGCEMSRPLGPCVIQVAAWGGPPTPLHAADRLATCDQELTAGFADVELSNGLRIRKVPVLWSHGKYRASLPSKPVLDRDGKHVETKGKKQYLAILEWRSPEIADAFSARVVELVRRAGRNALEEAGTR